MQGKGLVINSVFFVGNGNVINDFERTLGDIANNLNKNDKKINLLVYLIDNTGTNEIKIGQKAITQRNDNVNQKIIKKINEQNIFFKKNKNKINGYLNI